MKRILLLSLLPALALTACQAPRDDRYDRYERDQRGGRYGHQQQVVQEDRTVLEESVVESRPESTPPSSSSSAPDSSRTAPEPAVRRANLPNGIPIPGQTGQVYSPYKPNSGIVDVTGFPPGMEVRCPYTGKIFLVP